jgi:hypothetical protein
MIWHRIRGVLGISIVWAVAWLPLAVGLGLYRYWSDAPYRNLLPNKLEGFLAHMANAVGLGMLAGAVSGAIFAVILALAERNRTLSNLSIRRLAIWGGIGASLLPATFLSLEAFVFTHGNWWSGATIVLGIAAALGAASAAATLKLANRGSEPQLKP